MSHEFCAGDIHVPRPGRNSGWSGGKRFHDLSLVQGECIPVLVFLCYPATWTASNIASHVLGVWHRIARFFAADTLRIVLDDETTTARFVAVCQQLAAGNAPANITWALGFGRMICRSHPGGPGISHRGSLASGGVPHYRSSFRQRFPTSMPTASICFVHPGGNRGHLRSSTYHRHVNDQGLWTLRTYADINWLVGTGRSRHDCAGARDWWTLAHGIHSLHQSPGKAQNYSKPATSSYSRRQRLDFTMVGLDCCSCHTFLCMQPFHLALMNIHECGRTLSPALRRVDFLRRGRPLPPGGMPFPPSGLSTAGPWPV